MRAAGGDGMSDPDPGSDFETEGGPRQRSHPSGRVARARDRFEDAWRKGRAPRIEDYLAGAAGPERTALLGALLAVELTVRGKSGEHPTPQRYLARFPADATLIQDTFQALAPSVATSQCDRVPA